MGKGQTHYSKVSIYLVQMHVENGRPVPMANIQDHMHRD